MKKLYFMIFISTILLLQACSTTGETTEKEKEGANTESDGGVLVVAKKYDVTNLDPHFIVDPTTADALYQKVYETLVKPDENMQGQPHLATKWTEVDNVTWEFELRDDVTFHDGTKFNSDAVKATYDRLLDPVTGSPQADKLGMVKEVEVVDDYTVRFYLHYPYAPLLSILGSQEAAILNPTLLKDSSDDLQQVANGTGPFTFEKWVSGQGLTLKRNEDYWGELPSISGIEIKVVPEDVTRLGLIESGEAHIMDQVPVNEISRIESSDSMKLFRGDGLAVEFVGFSNRVAPVDNVLVRRAISHAINREPLISGVYNNVGVLSNSAMSPKVFGYDETLEAYEYDPEKAKELLNEAGFDFSQTLTLLTPDRAERISLAEVVQSQLKGIGVTIEIQVLELGAYLAAVDGEKGHMFNGLWGNVTGDGDYNQYNLFHTKSFGSAGNYQFYSNEKVDKLIDEARSEMDDEKRKAIYAETQRIELEDAAFIPIKSNENLSAFHSSVSGVVLNPSGYLMVDKIKISE